jgi:tetratricopeptide (TPR) repeat protein
MSRDDHLTRELVRAVLDGRLAPEAALRRLASHLASLCPQCVEAAAELLATGGGEPTLTQVEEKVARVVRRAEAAHAAAEDFVERLHALAPDRREAALRSAPETWGPALVLLLVAAARRHPRPKPEEALHWAELAFTAARLSGLEHDDFGVFAAAHVANTQRLANDLAGARRTFERDVFSTDLDRTLEDPAVAAEVWSFYGALLIDLRQLPEAVRALNQSAALAHSVADFSREGRALMQLAIAQEWLGEYRLSIASGRRAIEVLPIDDPLTVAAQFNLVHHLLIAGEVLEAEHRFTENRADFPAAWHTRTTWLEARLAAAEGDVERAEFAYREVEREYRQASRPLDVAMVCLDLSTLYLSSGREDEIPPLMETVLQTFASDPTRYPRTWSPPSSTCGRRRHCGL